MKKKYLFLIMVFALMFVAINVKAATGHCTGGGSCDAKETETYCNATSECSWYWDTCDTGYTPVGGVCKKATSLSASLGRSTIRGGGSTTISGSATWNGTAVSGNYSYAEGNDPNNVISVSGSTVTCANKNGEASVTVSFRPDESTYSTPARASATITCVYVAPETAVFTTLNAGKTTVWLEKGSSDSVNISAKDQDGNPIPIDSWSSSDTSKATIASACNGNANCTVTLKGWACNESATISITATKGSVTKSVSVTLKSYDEWHKVADDVQIPSGGHTKAEMAYQEGCKAYEEGTIAGRGEEWDRCCGGGTSEEPHCYKTPNNTYEVGKYAGQTGYTQVEDWKCERHCYKKQDGTLEVTDYQDGYEKLDDKYCVYACYQKPDGKYERTYYQDDYVKVDDHFCDETPTKHCFKKPDGTYEETLYQEGYEQVDEKFCQKHCYKKPDGTYEETYYQDGYEELDDKYCVYACYKKTDGTYEKTYYKDGYEKVDDKYCEIPDTASSISSILYAVGAFLVIIGSGIVVYQLTKVKQQID